jgi:hypothetical protein
MKLTHIISLAYLFWRYTAHAAGAEYGKAIRCRFNSTKLLNLILAVQIPQQTATYDPADLTTGGHHVPLCRLYKDKIRTKEGDIERARKWFAVFQIFRKQHLPCSGRP